jgi:hypothetical protein
LHRSACILRVWVLPAKFYLFQSAFLPLLFRFSAICDTFPCKIVSSGFLFSLHRYSAYIFAYSMVYPHHPHSYPHRKSPFWNLFLRLSTEFTLNKSFFCGQKHLFYILFTQFNIQLCQNCDARFLQHRRCLHVPISSDSRHAHHSSLSQNKLLRLRQNSRSRSSNP